jgi:hypothetical protein
MNIKDKLAAVLNRYRHYQATKGHHPCAARGTASKNTKTNPWNIRQPKSRRQPSRFAKLAVFKKRYGIN